MIFLKKLKLETEYKKKSRLKTFLLQALILMVLACFLRFVFYIVFKNSEMFSTQEIIRSIFLGIRFDFRAVFLCLLPSVLQTRSLRSVVSSNPRTSPGADRELPVRLLRRSVLAPFDPSDSHVPAYTAPSQNSFS